MAHEIKDTDEKLAYYRKSAADAERSAKASTDPDMRMAYLAVQRTWIYLAEELQREMALAGDDSMIDAPDDVFIPAAATGAAHKAR